MPVFLLFCVWLLFPCPPDNTSVPGKPLAGPEFKGEEQLWGNFTPSVPTSCLDLARPWGEQALAAGREFFQLHWRSSEPPDVACTWKHFLFPQGRGAAFTSPSPIRGQGLRGPSMAELDLSRQGHPREATFAASLGQDTSSGDNRSSPLSLHTEEHLLSLSHNILYVILQGKIILISLSSNIHNHNHKNIT